MNPPKIITYGLVGSRGYGVSSPDSDFDYMGVIIEPEEVIFGLHQFEVSERLEENGQIKVYGLKKFIRMILKGGPNALEMLWVKPDQKTEPYTSELLSLRQDVVSKRHLRAYSAYMSAQIHKLKSGRGSKGEQRPKLVEKYGFDTKFAYHILRLGMMGQVLGQTGRLYIPLDEFQRQILCEVRNGEWSQTKILNSAQTMAQGIEHYIQTSQLPDEPNETKIEEWLKTVYRREYGANASAKAV